jgi:hypothetical protein
MAEQAREGVSPHFFYLSYSSTSRHLLLLAHPAGSFDFFMGTPEICAYMSENGNPIGMYLLPQRIYRSQSLKSTTAEYNN